MSLVVTTFRGTNGCFLIGNMRVVRHHIRPLNNTVVNCTFDEHVMMTHSAFAASPSTAGFKVRANKAYILFHIERQLVNRSPVELPTSTTTDLLNQTSSEDQR